MEQSPSTEANIHAASQETPRLLWNSKSSLPCFQEPTTAPYPEPDESSPHPHISLRSILILSYCLTSMSSKRSLAVTFSN